MESMVPEQSASQSRKHLRGAFTISLKLEQKTSHESIQGREGASTLQNAEIILSEVRALGAPVLPTLLVEDPSYTTNKICDFFVGLGVLRLEGGLLLGELDLCGDR